MLLSFVTLKFKIYIPNINHLHSRLNKLLNMFTNLKIKDTKSTNSIVVGATHLTFTCSKVKNGKIQTM